MSSIANEMSFSDYKNSKGATSSPSSGDARVQHDALSIEVDTLSPRSKLRNARASREAASELTRLALRNTGSHENRRRKTIVKASREEIPFDCLP